jgi:hypothetical protein
MVLERNVNDTFVYIGVTEQQKLMVKAVIFRTSNVAFVPKETFTTFPNLNRICIHNTNLDYLSADYYRFFPKNKVIPGVDFYNCKIDKIDPDVWPYIKNAKIFNFELNVCLDDKFTDPNELVKKIQPCFENFRKSRHYTDKLKMSVSEETKTEKSGNGLVWILPLSLAVAFLVVGALFLVYKMGYRKALFERMELT